MAAGAALSAKRGETSKSSLRGASHQMAESMTEDQLEDFASTKRKKVPTKEASIKNARKKATAQKTKKKS